MIFSLGSVLRFMLSERVSGPVKKEEKIYVVNLPEVLFLLES